MKNNDPARIPKELYPDEFYVLLCCLSSPAHSASDGIPSPEASLTQREFLESASSPVSSSSSPFQRRTPNPSKSPPLANKSKLSSKERDRLKRAAQKAKRLRREALAEQLRAENRDLRKRQYQLREEIQQVREALLMRTGLDSSNSGSALNLSLTSALQGTEGSTHTEES